VPRDRELQAGGLESADGAFLTHATEHPTQRGTRAAADILGADIDLGGTMRHVFAFAMIGLFVLGLYVMGVANQYTGAEAYVFVGGLLLSTLAFLIPIQMVKD
jgi:hypothetical protein